MEDGFKVEGEAVPECEFAGGGAGEDASGFGGPLGCDEMKGLLASEWVRSGRYTRGVRIKDCLLDKSRKSNQKL